MLLLAVCMAASLALPVSADEPMSYDINGVGYPDYGTPTSIEVVHTTDNGAMKNEDVSKNAAMIPPAFGSPSADTLNTGTYLTPNLVPALAATGNIGGGNITFPPPTADAVYPFTSADSTTSTTPATSTAFTDVTEDMYYADRTLGTLSIPSLGVSARIVQGTDSTALGKGIGHFEETSIWAGNVALASHNRGASSYFGEIHTLSLGDTITLTTRLGTRTYEVVSVAKVSETDRSSLAESSTNILTLYTCVRDQRDLRWCVQAQELV